MFRSLATRRIATVAFIAALFLTSLPGSLLSASAYDESPTPGFSIAVHPGKDPLTTERGYFLYELGPGKRVTGELRLSNPTDSPIAVELLTADAITAGNGGSAFTTSDVVPASVGRWLEVENSTLAMDAHSDRIITFTVRVPKSAAPGQYLAGLSATAVDVDAEGTPTAADTDAAAASVTMRTRYVVGVEIDIPGEWVASLDVTSVHLVEQPSGTFLGIDMVNTGATFLSPSGEVTVMDPHGETVIQHTIQMGTFVTGTAITFPVPVTRPLDPGIYAVAVTMSYGDEQTARYAESLEIGTVAVATATISELRVTEARDSSTDALQFVTIDIKIENLGASISGGRLALIVTRDGEVIEELVLGEALTFVPGTAQTSQRYLPMIGWAPGTYVFLVTLDVVDVTSGKTIRLSDATATVTVD